MNKCNICVTETDGRYCIQCGAVVEQISENSEERIVANKDCADNAAQSEYAELENQIKNNGFSKTWRSQNRRASNIEIGIRIGAFAITVISAVLFIAALCVVSSFGKNLETALKHSLNLMMVKIKYDDMIASVYALTIIPVILLICSLVALSSTKQWVLQKQQKWMDGLKIDAQGIAEYIVENNKSEHIGYRSAATYLYNKYHGIMGRPLKHVICFSIASVCSGTLFCIVFCMRFQAYAESGMFALLETGEFSSGIGFLITFFFGGGVLGMLITWIILLIIVLPPILVPRIMNKKIRRKEDTWIKEQIKNKATGE